MDAEQVIVMVGFPGDITLKAEEHNMYANVSQPFPSCIFLVAFLWVLT